MKALSGLKRNKENSFDSLCFNGECVNATELPDVINDYIVSVSEAVPALKPEVLSAI
jgi:hypothetical protein